MLEETATLVNWVFNKKDNIFIGSIIADSRKRWPDYTKISTSLVQEVSEDGMYVHTLNSVYKLEPPFARN